MQNVTIPNSTAASPFLDCLNHDLRRMTEMAASGQLAAALAQDLQTEEAITELRQAAQMQPNEPRLHVALATVARADVILSWNFRHIVHLDKIRRFNAVNLRQGYAIMEIRSPREFV